MNLRKQVEPLGKSRASGFLLQRHAHHAASRLTWMKRWLKRAFRHHAQSRELTPWGDLSLNGVQGSTVQGSGFGSGFKVRFRVQGSVQGFRATLNLEPNPCTLEPTLNPE